MKKQTNLRKPLFTSVVSLLLCFAMLLGATFAWFTDEVTSAGNKIQSGNLKIDLELLNKETGKWSSLKENHDPIFNYANWEPGHTEVKILKVENEGSLALKWMARFITTEELSILKDVIDVYVKPSATELAYPGDRNLEGYEKVGTVGDFLNKMADTTKGTLEAGQCAYLGIALVMQETAGNEYQNMSLGGAFDICILATQYGYENDSFGNDYDENAAADFFPGFQGGSAGAAVNTNDQGMTTSEVAMDGGDVAAVIPAGVQVADGAAAMQLAVTLKNASESNIKPGENEEMRSLDVHIAGVAQGNTVPMLITLKHYLTTGINTGALKLYHVENGAPVAMTHVANPVNHNEFSYDPLTGDVTLALASFSEVAVIADTTNTWNGTAATAFAGGTGTEANPYLIANADQLAYFRNQVDGGRTFDNEFVKLTANIYLSNVNFDPIGWGYEYNDWNVGDVAGKPFKGTFDGGYYDAEGKLRCYTIYDLYQNGWDLTNAGTGEAYTYTNCGFGLFAAAADATFKNLTIYGADIRVECVETGILVGLSQGSCTYENINIHNSKIANYQRPTGGLIGEISPLNGGGETKITNVEIGSDVVVGSLWGDFDAPCGGVIGARWDDSNTTTVNMKDVTVGCRMDVYSDVTSAYQWYAYRRAGMLIGNTEQTAENNGHLAAARFLTCENVKVYYGNWAAYHYCQFTNQTDAQGNRLWNSNYPWVRVEAGENCSAYSNPRYGQPVINGATVTTHEAGTCTGDHNMELRFNQLYGGGQGVYGQPKHDGVEIINYRYSITYMNDYEVLAVKYVTESGAVSTANSAAQDLVEKWAAENITGTWEFGGWMNAGSTKLDQIDANNAKDIVLYPYFNKPYTARFVDQKGNVLAYCFFHKEDLTKLDDTKDAAQSQLPAPGTNFEFDYWEVNANGTKVQYNEKNFANYGYDVTIYPVYRYTGNLKLTPVDEDSDGTIDYYKVEAVAKLDEVQTIPGDVNGIPVKLVEKLYENENNTDYASGVKTIIIEEGVEVLAQNSLAYTSDLDIVKLPSTITTLQKNSFSRNYKEDTKVIEIQYNGTMAEWKAILNNSATADDWHNGLRTGTKIICTDGYFELKYTDLSIGDLYEFGRYKWTEYPKTTN